MSLFGHHHAAPTVASRIAEAGAGILHLPLAVWLTIIPIAGGLAIAYVTHQLNLSRDRVARRREDERRRADDERAATRVRADLSLRLARHREALRAAARGDVARLRTEHDALVRRAAKADVIDVLGGRYAGFLAVVQREEALLGALARRDADYAGDSAFADLDAAFAQYADCFALPGAPAAIETAR